MKQNICKSLLGFLISIFGFTSCSSAPNKSLSLNVWINRDVDIAVVYIHSPQGKLLWKEWKLIPYRKSYQGWEFGGPELLAFVKELPENLMISWRLPSPKETPYDRCERQFGNDCEKLAINKQLGFTEYEDGELIGPFKMPVTAILDSKAVKMLERNAGSFNTLQMGVGIGSEKLNVRWILKGTPPVGVVAAEGVTELSRGGDW